MFLAVFFLSSIEDLYTVLALAKAPIQLRTDIMWNALHSHIVSRAAGGAGDLHGAWTWNASGHSVDYTNLAFGLLLFFFLFLSRCGFL